MSNLLDIVLHSWCILAIHEHTRLYMNGSVNWLHSLLYFLNRRLRLPTAFVVCMCLSCLLILFMNVLNAGQELVVILQCILNDHKALRSFHALVCGRFLTNVQLHLVDTVFILFVLECLDYLLRHLLISLGRTGHAWARLYEKVPCIVVLRPTEVPPHGLFEQLQLLYFQRPQVRVDCGAALLWLEQAHCLHSHTTLLCISGLDGFVFRNQDNPAPLELLRDFFIFPLQLVVLRL